MSRKWICVILACLMAVSMAVVVGCETDEPEEDAVERFPDRPLEIVIPWAAGGGSDMVFRAFASVAEDYFDEHISISIVEGGAGTIGTAEVADAEPDGYTMINYQVGPITLQPHQQDLPYDAIEDLEPVAMINTEAVTITTSEDAPYDNLEEFVEYVEENHSEDDPYVYGHSAFGGVPHITGTEFFMEAGINDKMDDVTYDGSAPSVEALLGDEVGMILQTVGEVRPHVEADEFKILCTFAEDRVDLYEEAEEVETAKEQGYDIVGAVWRGLAVPSGTPQEIVDHLEEATLATIEDETFQGLMDDLGTGITPMTSEELEEYVHEEYEIHGQILEDLGLTE